MIRAEIAYLTQGSAPLPKGGPWAEKGLQPEQLRRAVPSLLQPQPPPQTARLPIPESLPDTEDWHFVEPQYLGVLSPTRPHRAARSGEFLKAQCTLATAEQSLDFPQPLGVVLEGQQVFKDKLRL